MEGLVHTKTDIVGEQIKGVALATDLKDVSSVLHLLTRPPLPPLYVRKLKRPLACQLLLQAHIHMHACRHKRCWLISGAFVAIVM